MYSLLTDELGKLSTNYNCHIWITLHHQDHLQIIKNIFLTGPQTRVLPPYLRDELVDRFLCSDLLQQLPHSSILVLFPLTLHVLLSDLVHYELGDLDMTEMHNGTIPEQNIQFSTVKQEMTLRWFITVHILRMKTLWKLLLCLQRTMSWMWAL